MFGLSYLELALLTNAVAAICFALILMLINVPHTEHSKRLVRTKNMIAITYLACAWIFIFTLENGPHGKDFAEFELFAEMMILVATAVSTASLSYALISLMDEKAMSRDLFIFFIILVALFSIVFARIILAGQSLARWIMIFIIVLGQIIQCGIHTGIFIRVFRRTRKTLAQYYDEDEDHRLRWIRFCFTVMMLTEIFVIIYLPLPHGAMTIYAFWFITFMLYFTSNFISFLSSHKLLLDAFAHKTLARGDSALKLQQDNKSQFEAISADTARRDREFRAIEKKLKKWVDEQRYREYDKSREEIAGQLGTSKEMLQLYFTVKIGEDFRTWRTALRIEDAKKMLLEDKKASTNLIAEITGFSDRSNFHRQFTKTVGCSPKEWRDTDGHPESL